ncbi:MAG TPA: YbaK/EbsC family protein [Candidatus Nanoarchaeia archaeon]|nr:YbaK/EbsC family protein [Candidatus Nanoarchaeia archaeon]
MSRQVLERIIALLRARQISFELFEHEPVRTSEEAAFMRAQRSGLSPEEHLKRGAKAMVLRSEGMENCTCQVAQLVQFADSEMRLNHDTNCAFRYKFIQVVISAAKKVDLAKVKKLLNTDSLSLASPIEVENAIDCVPGSVPPFGSLFNIPVYVDKSLLSNEFMDFSAGEKTVSIEMKVKDWQALVKPVVCDVACREG